MKKPIFTKLRQLRTLSKINTETISKELGISKSMYIYIESGRRRLSYDLAVKIAAFFKMNPDDIFLEDTKAFLKNSTI